MQTGEGDAFIAARDRGTALTVVDYRVQRIGDHAHSWTWELRWRAADDRLKLLSMAAGAAAGRGLAQRCA